MSFIRILKKIAQVAILFGLDKKLKRLIVKKLDKAEERIYKELDEAEETRELLDPKAFIEVDDS